MKNPLNKRLKRDLINNKGRYCSIALMMIVTIALISGFLAVSDGIQKSFKQNRIDCKLEDGSFISYDIIADDTISKVEKLGTTVCENFYTNEEISKGNTLRIFKNRNEINTETIMEGKFPENKNEIAIERLFAENNHLNIGDKLTIYNTEMTITGYVSVPDYSSLFENNSNLMMDSFHFGIGFVSEDAFDNVTENRTVYNYSYYFNNRDLSDKNKLALSDDIKKCLVNNGTILSNFLTAENNQSITFIEDDMGSDVPMMKVFLFIIIGILAFVFAIVICSTIETESAIIGTLLASGYGKYELVQHYMAMPIIVTLFSAIIGNIIGYTVVPGICEDMYYGSYSLPPMEIKLNGEALLLTTLLPIMLMIIINFVVLSRKLSITPLDFLRRELKKKKHKKSFQLPNVSFFNRFRMRIIIQNISSYLMLFIGIFFASFILLFGLCMKPMITHYTDLIKSATVCDYQYILKAPMQPEKLGNAEEFSAFKLETFCNLSDKNVETTFYGLNEESKYFSDLHIPENEDGIYLSEGLSKKINAEIGDIISFTDTYTDKKYDLKVAGIYDYPVGLSAFMNRKQLNTLFGYKEDYCNGYFSNEKLIFSNENYIATVITPDDMSKLGDQMMASFGKMAPLCLSVAVIIYLVLMYILTKIVIDKNAICISYLKVFGYEQKEIKSLYLKATTIVVILSLLLGLPMVYLGIQGSFILVLMKISGYLPIYIPYYLYVEVVAIGIASYFIINFFHVKKINKIQMTDALKNRE